MSQTPPVPVPLAEARRAAERQAQRLSAGMAAALGTVVALVVTMAFVLLDYRFEQAWHRLVKVLVGVGVMALIVLLPRFGLLVIPVVTPFLSWAPRVPIPGVNVLNVLLFTVFATWALRRVAARERIVRRGRMGGLLLGIVGLAALSIVRGAAFPTGYHYEAIEAAWGLVRCAMTFAIYFLVLWMARGPRDRRHLTWAIVIGLLAESLITIAYGRNGRGGRAIGSFGQPNELGGFLAMFTAFAVAQLPAARSLWTKLLLVGTGAAGGLALVMTVSRGAVLALVAALFYVGLRSSRILTAVLLLVLLSSPLWAPDYLKERMTGTQVTSESSDDVALEGSAQLRVDTWRAIMNVVSAHPLDGVGFSGLEAVLPDMGTAMGVEVKDTAHNTFLRFLGEMGVLGLALFLLLLWRCWSLGHEAMRLAATPADRSLGLGLASATLALAVSCAFGDRFFSILISGNFWMACALTNDLVIERREAAA